jgi:lipopolysaccharide biosynthesis glycosyltransferase
MKNCYFTICARNYLAQALTLRDSLRHINEEVRIYVIDLSEDIDCSVNESIYDVTESLLPDYHQLAMKYDVTEYSTSIKPYCFSKLFEEGYDKVIYLDPDMYIYGTLDYITENLNKYSIVLTPHFCNIQINSNTAGYDKNLLCDGIYNLGFVAIKNDDIETLLNGGRIV